MPSSRILIASNTLGSSAASVTFSSIPATYTDLVVRVSARADITNRNLKITFNNTSPSATTYSRVLLYGTGSAATSIFDASVETFAVFGGTVQSSYTANTFSSTEIYIPSYTVSQNKPIGAFGTTENNATESIVTAGAGLWRDTSTINRIDLAPNSGNFVSGSTFWLYGLKNS